MYLPTKELPVTSPAKVGQYHELAEAMRRGCKLLPYKIRGKTTDGLGGACAIGAAIAGGYRFYWIPNKLARKIFLRNDWLFWSRERIADWLDTL